MTVRYWKGRMTELREAMTSIELHLRHIGVFGADDPAELRRLVLEQADRLAREREPRPGERGQ